MAQLLIIFNLLNPRGSFEINVKVLNWLLGYQGFDPQIKVTEKAFDIWRRDLWILFVTNPLIIVFIHLI